MLHHHLGDFLLFFFQASWPRKSKNMNFVAGWCYVMLNYVMKCHVMDLHLGGFKHFLLNK